MDIDEAFRQVGEYGKLQRRVFWSMAIPQIFVAWHHMHNVFVAAEPEFYCVREGEQTKGCSEADAKPCDWYYFPETDFSSIASEWNLVCDNAYKTDLVQSIYMFGLLVGNLIGGYIADQHGRRHVSYISVLGISVLSVIAISSQSYESYVVFRFLAAISTGAYGLVSFTLPAELVGAGQRGFVNVVTSLTFALGITSFSILAYFVRDWHFLSMITAAPGLIGIYYFRDVPESPRWLLTQGRVEEAEAVLTRMSVCNTGQLPSRPIVLKSLQSSRVKQASMFDIVRHSGLLRLTINNMFTWFVSSMVYYGLTMRLGNLGGDKYVNVAFAGLVEIPACLLTLYLMDKHGRTMTYSWSLLFGGIVCVAIMFLPHDFPSSQTVLALLGKTFISMAVCVAWMHAAEMYPTNIRNKALSLCNMSARLGGVIAPLVLTLGRVHLGFDFALFGILTFLSGVAARKLPETLNRSLPETVDDVDHDNLIQSIEKICETPHPPDELN